MGVHMCSQEGIARRYDTYITSAKEIGHARAKPLAVFYALLMNMKQIMQGLTCTHSPGTLHDLPHMCTL